MIIKRLPRARHYLIGAIAIIPVAGFVPLLVGHAAAATGPSTLPSTTLVSSPPPGAIGPDDITSLATPGLDAGHLVIWTAFQNAINPNGTPATPGGPTQSTVAGYDSATGSLVSTIAVTGKVDGLTADPALHALIATVNEDDNSSFNLVDPSTGTVTNYTYNINPAVSGNGGTDSIAVSGGQIFVTHSDPSDVTQPTEYSVSLDGATHTANLTPLFYDNSAATDAVTGAPVTLALTDPDTNGFIPPSTSQYGGMLATVSQGDGQIIFSSTSAGGPLKDLNMTDNVSGNVPPIDGLAVATAGRGTLYVVDGSGIVALDTSGWPSGTVFVGEPSDNKNPLVGTLNLATGVITPFGNTFGSPKGIVFVPTPGYDMVGSDGGVFTHGESFFGSEGNAHLSAPFVGMVVDPATGGYWLVGSDGGVNSFGAPFYGSMAGHRLNKPVVGIAATPDGGGYWLVAADGGIFGFGDALYYGSLPGSHIVPAQPIVGIAASPDGAGYWLAGSDGGVFNFGDAPFHGSEGGVRLNAPVVGIAATADGGGYWLAGSDGGVFTFGTARFMGSECAVRLNKPIVGIVPTFDGGGYWLAGSDGGVFTFGDAPFLGSEGATRLNKPVVGIGTN